MPDAFATIRATLGQLYRGELDSEAATTQLEQTVSPLDLADFIVAARNRGWISNFNLGLNENGEPI